MCCCHVSYRCARPCVFQFVAALETRSRVRVEPSLTMPRRCLAASPAGRPSRRRRATFVVILGVLVALGACGTSAIGVSVCDQIEDARCTRLGTIGHLCTDPDSSTPIDFLAPFADATDPTPENIAACIRFYSTACLHGLVSPDLPSTGQVNDCLAAINDGSCAVVVDPVTADACLWLAEGGPEAEAATEDADAKDDDDTTKFSVGGTVTGLASADSVTLQDN